MIDGQGKPEKFSTDLALAAEQLLAKFANKI